MKIGDSVRGKYSLDMEGVIVRVSAPQINPYNIMVKCNTKPRVMWANFPIGNFQEKGLILIKEMGE